MSHQFNKEAQLEITGLLLIVELKVFNPHIDGSQIFMENLVNTMAVDAQAPCITRPSADMVLTMQILLSLVFHKVCTIVLVSMH